MFLDPKNTAVCRATGVTVPRRFRWLAAPAAGLLIACLVAGVTPGTASATSSGKLSVSPSSGSLVSLASTRLSSRTVVNLKVPTSLPFYSAIQLRSATAGAGYRAKAGIAANGTVTVSLSRVKAGVETVIGTPQSTGITVRSGQTIRLQGAVAGTNPVRLYVRTWKTGTNTPRWQLATRDYTTSRITTPGKTRLWGYLPSTATATTKVAFHANHADRQQAGSA